MHIGSNEKLAQVIHEYSKVVASFQKRKKWHELSEQELWGELCLCILSSNVPYELALSTFWHLRNKRLLRPEWIVRCKNAVKRMSYELSKPIYLPRKKDGSRRKYRFPNTRAQNIVRACKTLYQKNDGLLQALKNFNNEQAARDFLASNVSGIGLKQASHFLRNVGYSSSLAIIDSHVITFLAEVGVISQEKINVVTPKMYITFERILKNLCEGFGFNLSIFDMAIWRCMRGKQE